MSKTPKSRVGSNKRDAKTGKFKTLGKTYDGIVVQRPHSDPKSIPLDKLRRAVKAAKAVQSA